MGSIHPLFHSAAANSSALTAPAMKPFKVRIGTGTSQTYELSIMAFTACDAITKAIDIYFDGDEEMPSAGLVVDAEPLNLIPQAA
jgi:hypothetical protein